MINEAKMTELAQAEDMAYFRADICCYSPEGDVRFVAHFQKRIASR